MLGVANPAAECNARGAALVYNSPLVEWYQGNMKTTTSAVTEDVSNCGISGIPKSHTVDHAQSLGRPNVRSVEGMVMLVRALKTAPLQPSAGRGRGRRRGGMGCGRLPHGNKMAVAASQPSTILIDLPHSHLEGRDRDGAG
jgi:hypothetical protein